MGISFRRNLFSFAAMHPVLFMSRLIFTLVLCCSSLPGLVQVTINDLSEGDLIFIGTQKSGWSRAINDVTQTGGNTSYHHTGLIIAEGDQWYLMHAAPENGVEQVPLHTYLDRLDSQTVVDIYRIRGIDTMDLEKVKKSGSEMLGSAYNYAYVFNDSTHYCSEFVYRCFAPYRVFTLEPMTFKVNGETLAFWKTYYEELGTDIPEGQPGCNPNGMAAGRHVHYLGRLAY